MQKMKIGLYYCSDCSGKYTLDQCEEEYGDHYCPDCGGAVKFNSERDAEWYSVAAYMVGREYGGPEEGGWYYDSGRVIPETVRAFPAAEFSDAKAYWDKLQSIYSDKPYLQVRYYAEKNVMQFPSKRPYYC